MKTNESVFFLIYSFAYAHESKKRGFTVHLGFGKPINTGLPMGEPTLHLYSR